MSRLTGAAEDRFILPTGVGITSDTRGSRSKDVWNAMYRYSRMGTYSADILRDARNATGGLRRGWKMSNLKRMGFIPVRPNKREQRMNKALDRIYNRKVSEISRDRAVQYATSAFIMAMHELYGWSSVRSGRVISSSMDKWGSFTKADEHKLMDAAKSIGVDVEATTELGLSENNPKALNMTDGTYRNFKSAINDVHLMMAACLVVLHDNCRFGELRLNKVMNHMWQQYLRACQTDGKSIMQMCEEETGICVVGGEDDGE